MYLFRWAICAIACALFITGCLIIDSTFTNRIVERITESKSPILFCNLRNSFYELLIIKKYQVSPANANARQYTIIQRGVFLELFTRNCARHSMAT